MKKHYCMAIAGLLAIVAFSAQGQVTVGGKFGVNYLIASQKLQPEPKNAPTTPKGLGLGFGAFVGIPFSDMVGIRPELAFSFRRGKSELTDNISLKDNTEVTGGQGAFTGTRDYRAETDQRLSYFQVTVPLTISPADGLRIMAGPSLNFLMGGKVNVDETVTWKGNVVGQNQQGQQVTQAVDQQDFEASKKKGSAAIKDFKKADIMVMAGIGYTLSFGLDMDLRYYRGLSPSYDRTEGTARQRNWTNLVEVGIGWQFGGQ